MEELQDSDIVFITTTQYTPWLEWSQKSIKKHFPNSQTIVINGTSNWPIVWFKWLEYLPTLSQKYFIFIDEDCFVLDRQEILSAIRKMINRQATLAAVPDSFFTWRCFNEVALNPFFMIGDRVKLLQAISSPNWFRLRFKQEYFNTVSYDFPVDIKRTCHEYEPFYNLFWAVLEAKQTLLYLYPSDDNAFLNQDNRLPGTNVRVMPDTPSMVLHMWYSRQWNDHQNASRYAKLKDFLEKTL